MILYTIQAIKPYFLVIVSCEQQIHLPPKVGQEIVSLKTAGEGRKIEITYNPICTPKLQKLLLYSKTTKQFSVGLFHIVSPFSGSLIPW